MVSYEDAYRYAVKNAFLHKGKADVNAVMAKMIALEKELDLEKAVPLVQDAVNAVNSRSFGEIEIEYRKFEEKGYELKPKQKESMLPELPWAESDEVVTRFAPNPNGPFHLGNARAAVLSDEFAKIYGGKMLLRFDDTDPKVKKPIENAEEIFKEDLHWLGCNIAATFFASDRLDIYYGYLKKLIELGKAYVCSCPSEEWRKAIQQGKACICRVRNTEEQLVRLEKMLSNDFREGEAVLRIKTNLKHPDPSIRDWWAAKVVDSPKHPNPNARDKHVWPSYNFASAIDDHELGITLIIRGQEHEQNKTKQEFLYSYLGWRYPHCFHFGRIKLADAVLSTSKIKEGIEKGEYDGWDDPRLGTIRALRRRGFQAEALRKAILEVGVKSADVQIDSKRLADLNRDTLEETRRVVFFQKPMRLDVNYAQGMSVEVDGQKFELKDGTQQFVVDSEGMKKFYDGSVFRLRNAYNVKVMKKDPLQVFANFVGTAQTGKPIVPWLLQGNDVVVVMPDNSKTAGIAGEEIAETGEGSVVYLDRFGFCRIDSIEGKKVVLFFAHK